MPRTTEPPHAQESTDVPRATAEPSRGFGWGVLYEGCGNPGAAAEAVETVLGLLGLRCRLVDTRDEALVVEGRQQAPWYRIVLGALPQRIDWRIAEHGGRLCIGSDLRLFRWYASLTLVVSAAAGACLLAAFDLFANLGAGRGSPVPGLARSPAVEASLGLAGLAFTLFGVYLLTALGGRHSDALWHAVLARLEKDGEPLEPVSSGLRYPAAMIGYALYILVLAVWIVASELPDHAKRLPTGMVGLHATLLVVVLLLLTVAVLLVGRRAFNLRTYPLLPGLASALAVLFFLSVPLPWWASGVSPEQVRALDTPESSSSRILYCLPLAGSALLAAGSLALARFGARTTLRSWPQLYRLQQHRGRRGIYRDAVRSGPALRLVRGFVLTVWLLLSAVILAGEGFAVACAIVAAMPMDGLAGELRLAELSAETIAFALGRLPGDPWTGVAVRSGWVLYGLAALALSVLSAGTLLRERRRTRRRLASSARNSPEGQRRLQEMLDRLRRRKGRCPPVRVVVTQRRARPKRDPAGGAQSHRIGLLHPLRYIEVDERALDLLPDREASQALIAHELAHQFLGHCTIHALARWLGRLTFVGDGFARSLLDSFGFESAADRAAVDELQTPPEALIACIRAVHGTTASSGGPRPHRPLRPQHRSAGFTSLSGAQRRRLAWRLFRKQYTTAGGLHYWHPAVEERLAALGQASLARRENGQR